MDDKIFIPFSEALLAAAGSPPGELVPYQLTYRCLRLPNGVYEFTTDTEEADSLGPAQTTLPEATLQRDPQVVHAA